MTQDGELPDLSVSARRRGAERILAALKSSGLAIVPSEPTEAMLNAGEACETGRAVGYNDEIWVAAGRACGLPRRAQSSAYHMRPYWSEQMVCDWIAVVSVVVIVVATFVSCVG